MSERIDVLVDAAIHQYGKGAGKMVRVVVNGEVVFELGVHKKASPSDIAVGLRQSAQDLAERAEGGVLNEVAAIDYENATQVSQILMKAAGKVPGIGL